MSDVTRILSQIESGDPAAAERLLPLVYDELRTLAAAKLVQEQPGQTLQATALVHEAYLRLVGQPGVRSQESGVTDNTERGSLTPDPCSLTPVFDSRGHFFAAAAESMRRILIETARRKQSRRHGGGLQRHGLTDVDLASPDPPEDLLLLDAALDKLASVDKPAADVVKLRFFAGLPMAEAAELLAISPRTADRLWAYAKAWLHREISGEIAGDEEKPDDSRRIVA